MFYNSLLRDLHGTARRRAFNRLISVSHNNYVSYVYSITFQTGNKFGAGTDSNVYIRMVGQLGSTDELKIESLPEHLERGMSNTYQVATDYVGPLKKLIVRHDSTGIGPAWYLEKVTVRDGQGGLFQFDCNSWLQKTLSRDAIKLLKPKIETETVQNAPRTHHVSSRPPVINKKSTHQVGNPSQSKDGTAKNHLSLRHVRTISPAVRLLLSSYGIDVQHVTGTGPHSRVLKGDILAHVQKENLTPVMLDQIKPTAPQEKPIEPVSTEKSQSIISRTIETSAILTVNDIYKPPQVYMNTRCCLEQFKMTLNYLSTVYEHQNTMSLQTAVLTRLFAKALLAVIGQPTEINIQVDDRSTGVFLLKHCASCEFDQLLQQHKTDTYGEEHSPSPYVLNVQLSSGGVSQMSTVLQNEQTLSLNVTGEKVGVASSGKISSQCTLALTSNGRVINELQSALLLQKLKSFIENPDLVD